MRTTATLILAIALASAASATVIFEDSFETIDERWVKNINGGDGTIEIVEGGVDGKCVKITSQGAVTYLSMELDPKLYAGTTTRSENANGEYVNLARPVRLFLKY